MNPLFALAAATFAAGTQSYVFGGLLSEMAADLDVTIGNAGLIAAVFAVTFAVAAPFAGALAARMDKRLVLVLALVATGVFNSIAVLTPNFEALLGIRILAALAAAFINPIASATAVMLVAPERRGRALALVTAGLTVAFTLGIPLGSVIGGAFGWRVTFLFAGLVGFAAAAIVAFALPAVAPAATARQPLAKLLSDRRVLSSFALTFLGFMATFTAVAYLGPIVNAAAGLTGAAVGPFQAAIGIGSLVGVMIGGRIADTANARIAIGGLYALMALSLSGYTFLLTGNGGAFVAPLLVTVIFSGAVALFAMMPVVQARLARASPTGGPVLFGLNGTMIFAGQGAGALYGGTVADTAGFAAIGVAGAAIALVAMIVAIVTVRTETVAIPAGEPAE